MKKALLFLGLFLAVKSAHSTTYTAIANGDFESAATWSPAGGPPGAGDDVIIPSGFTVTVTANNTAQLSGLNLAGTLTFTNGAKLSFSAAAVVQVATGGTINGGNPGAKLVFPGASYAGPFTTTGPFYYTNNGSGAGTLAVKLTSFKNELVSNGVKISWETENEVDIDVYEVQWSASGTDNWKTINVQKAANLSTAGKYSFVHQAGLSQKNYYRLKTLEKNGTYAYSEIIIAIKNNKAGFQISPSVTTGALLCKMASADLSSIKITDLSGKIITQVNNINAIQYSMPVNNLPNGVYFISLVQNGNITTEKFIKQ